MIQFPEYERIDLANTSEQPFSRSDTEVFPGSVVSIPDFRFRSAMMAKRSCARIDQLR
jgi:hypothetical protein